MRLVPHVSYRWFNRWDVARRIAGCRNYKKDGALRGAPFGLPANPRPPFAGVFLIDALRKTRWRRNWENQNCDNCNMYGAL
jgi:hypothetical protein